MEDKEEVGDVGNERDDKNGEQGDTVKLNKG
jgi:hypothetical protein